MQFESSAAREWLAEREAELLPVPYFHAVYTLPSPLRDIAYQNHWQCNRNSLPVVLLQSPNRLATCLSHPQFFS